MYAIRSDSHEQSERMLRDVPLELEEGTFPRTHPDEENVIVLIERRHLVRECLKRCLEQLSGHRVLALPSVQDCSSQVKNLCASVVVVSSGGRSLTDTQEDFRLLAKWCAEIPAILLSDGESPDRILELFEEGGKGYIPTSMPIKVAIEAIRLVKAGGTFVPASSLVAARRSADSPSPGLQVHGATFTARQAAVIEELRRGKANKIIAYELNMRESTVKVHVRNIMRKLNARNRTEVAFLANSL